MIFVKKWGIAIGAGFFGWLLVRRFIMPALLGFTLAVGGVGCSSDGTFVWEEGLSDYELATETWNEELTSYERIRICESWNVAVADSGVMSAQANMRRFLTSPPDALNMSEANAMIRVLREKC